jgi:hypothetical protein
LYEDGRKHYRTDGFYDIFPEIEIDAKCFVMEKATSKSSSFCLADLARYVTERFEILTEAQEDDTTGFNVRSTMQCRRDLIRWGFYLGENRLRPYCEGHERDDVVAVRKSMVDYFTANKCNYFTLSETEDCSFIQPFRQEDIPFKPTILISHDESTFRSGDVSRTKWMFPGKEPLFSKGRKRSLMVSDFIINHPGGPFLVLSDDEWADACKVHPELLQDDTIDFSHHGPSAFIALNGDNYFDNDTILYQFERMFKLLKFKREFHGYNFEFLVDNATTHTTREFSIEKFAKGKLDSQTH